MRRSQPWLTNRSRVLRLAGNSTEHALWTVLRNRQLGGFKFVRQEPMGPYFVDFVYRDRKLVVEVDGATHSAAGEISQDQSRDAYLAQRGYRVIRVSNDDVRSNLDGVRETIMAELKVMDETAKQAAAPHPGPLPAGGERG